MSGHCTEYLSVEVCCALHTAQYGVWYYVDRHVWFYVVFPGYSGVCTEVGIATGPALGAETSQWTVERHDKRYREIRRQ